jgi:DNA-binding transcriptional LysR family regulator
MPAAHDLKPGIRNFSSLDIITWTEEFAHLRGGPWFAEHAPDANVALQANSRRIQYGACKSGIGLAILPCLSADDDPDLIRLLPPEQCLSRSSTLSRTATLPRQHVCVL